jgi:hypothetical protein
MRGWQILYVCGSLTALHIIITTLWRDYVTIFKMDTNRRSKKSGSYRLPVVGQDLTNLASHREASRTIPSARRKKDNDSPGCSGA